MWLWRLIIVIEVMRRGRKNLLMNLRIVRIILVSFLVSIIYIYWGLFFGLVIVFILNRWGVLRSIEIFYIEII